VAVPELHSKTIESKKESVQTETEKTPMSLKIKSESQIEV